MKDETPEYVKWSFTAVGLGIAGFALTGKEFGYALPFVLIAMVPWCNFEKLTLLGSGIWFSKQLQKAEKTIRAANLPEPERKTKSSQNRSAIITVPVDLTTTILQQRQDIENRLQKLSEKHNIKRIYNEVLTVAGYVDRLQGVGVLDRNESAAVLNSVGVFNRALHGVTLSQDKIMRALSIGESIRALLDAKLTS